MLTCTFMWTEHSSHIQVQSVPLHLPGLKISAVIYVDISSACLW